MMAQMVSVLPRPFVVVEQLNPAQWHVMCPGTAGGVLSYVQAVADALWIARDRGFGVETVDLDFNRLVLAWPGRVS